MSAANQHLEVITKFVAAREKNPKAALFALKSTVQDILPDNRVKICYHHRLPERETVEIWRNPEEKRAYYRNLMKCGQGWVCPVCAQRLSEIRRRDLRLALDNSRDQFLPLMVTYTTRHHKGQYLQMLLGNLLAAYRRMRQQRIWRTYKDEYMIVGETRALEITWSENGWHPHFHTILWCDIRILEAIKNEDNSYDVGFLASGLENHLTDLWIESLQATGLSALQGPALNVRTSWDLLNDYVTKSGKILPENTEKWGLSEEMTKGQFKKQSHEGLTPWDLLIETFAGMDASKRLFLEYVEATKGKSALQWTPHMRERLGLVTDENTEVTAEEFNEGDILLLSFDVHEWRKIVATGATGILLDAASTGNSERIERVLSKVDKMYQPELIENDIG